MVNFTLPFTINEMISISTSQTFRSWVVIFQLCRLWRFYDTPRLATRMNVLSWGSGDFRVSYSNRDTSLNAWNRQEVLWPIQGSYSSVWSLLLRMLNDFLTLDQQWLPNRSDCLPILCPWYRAWPSPNFEWFPWSICNGCGMLAGIFASQGGKRIGTLDPREDARGLSREYVLRIPSVS